MQIVHIVGDKRVVGGADAELHRQIEASGGFAAARDAEQDHLRLIEVAQRNAVIVRQGIVDGGDAGVVLAEIAGGQAVGAVRHRRRFHIQLALQRADQRLHDILAEALALDDHIAHFRRDNGVKHQRAHAGFMLNIIDLLANCARAGLGFDKRQGIGGRRDRELRQHRVSQHFGGDRRTIRNIKNASFHPWLLT